MIKSALNTYKKNIWDIFAVVGFVSIGIFIGLIAVIPAIRNLIFVSYNKIIAEATSIHGTFNSNTFLNSLNNQINNLDWSNPIRTLKILFENNGLLNIITRSLKDAGFNEAQLGEIINGVIKINDNFIKTTYAQISIFVVCITSISLIGYLLTKIVIQMRSVQNNNILRFIICYILNAASMVLIYFLLLLVLVNLQGVGMVFSLIAIFIMLLLLTLIIAMLCYKTKEIKLFDILNIKNILSLFLSGLIIHAISFAVFGIVLIFSDLFAIFISIPLFLITTIIIENIVVNYITRFKNKEIITNNNQKV